MTSNLHLVIGTRGSQLALAQANATADALRARCPGARVELREVTTRGDRDRSTPFSNFGATGLFVKEIERQLIDGAIDLAVHSMKDVPTEMDERLAITAVPAREDARDALISRERLALAALAPAAVVGTSSPRRRAQLLHLRADLRIAELRGNLDTRLRKLEEGRYDAIVLAMAGLKRLGLADRVTHAFDIEKMLPAVGQGALALQTRRDDPRVTVAVKTLDVPEAAAAVEAERAFLARLGGGCQMPIGAHATVKGADLALIGCISDPDAKRCFRGRRNGDITNAAAVGEALAEQLLTEGADAIVGAKG